jgi:hypothetical protein
MSTKYSSPESSPIKNVPKKKRKISTSSEEEADLAPVAKKISSTEIKKSPKTVKEKKATPKKSPAAKKTPKPKTPEVKPSTSAIKADSPENKPQNGQISPEKVPVTSMNVLKIQSADTKGADFNPGKKNYHPINDAFWKKGEK